jgi:hypothetical protein
VLHQRKSSLRAAHALLDPSVRSPSSNAAICRQKAAEIMEPPFVADFLAIVQRRHEGRCEPERLAAGTRASPTLRTFVRRKSTWVRRFSKSVFGSIKLLMVTVPVHVASPRHEPRLRPRGGRICAFVYVRPESAGPAGFGTRRSPADPTEGKLPLSVAQCLPEPGSVGARFHATWAVNVSKVRASSMRVLRPTGIKTSRAPSARTSAKISSLISRSPVTIATGMSW